MENRRFRLDPSYLLCPAIESRFFDAHAETRQIDTLGIKTEWTLAAIISRKLALAERRLRGGKLLSDPFSLDGVGCGRLLDYPKPVDAFCSRDPPFERGRQGIVANGGLTVKTVKGLFDNVISYFRIEHLIFLVPICGFALYDSVFQAFSSILGVLREAYPDASVTTIQMIIAIPPMASIPGTLLSGVLSSYVRKKRIVEFALAVIFVGGMIPVVFGDPTLEAMFACSACVGVGQGLLHPMANAFICQTWEDDQRSRALGFKQSFNFIGDALVALCVGYLSLSHWGNAFLVYLGVIPIFILAHVLFPEGELEQKLVTVRPHARRRATVANGSSHCDEMFSDGDSSSSQSRGAAVPHAASSVATTRTAGLRELFKPRMVYLFVLFAFAMMFLYGFNTNIAMLVQERGLGNAADVSKIASVVSITSFLLGIIYGKVTEVCGRYTLVAGYVLLACGMLVASFGTSLPAIAFGGILFWLGIGDSADKHHLLRFEDRRQDGGHHGHIGGRFFRVAGCNVVACCHQ